MKNYIKKRKINHKLLIMNGEDIVNICKKLNLTQEELAKKVGVSQRTIQNYEKLNEIDDKKHTILSSFMFFNSKILLHLDIFA